MTFKFTVNSNLVNLVKNATSIKSQNFSYTTNTLIRVSMGYQHV